MRVTVNHARCQGHAMCVLYAPDLFELDDDGYNRMAPFDVRPEDEPAARRACEACPEKAISIEE